MARLRFADESLIESQFACPDCGKGVEIARGDGEWRAVPAKLLKPAVVPKAETEADAKPAEADAAPPPPTPAQTKADRLAEWIDKRDAAEATSASDGGTWSSLARRAKSCLAACFGWLQSPIAVAWTVAAFATLTIIVWLLKDEPWGPRTSDANGVAGTESETHDEQPISEQTEQTAVELQLVRLGGRLDAYQSQHGYFPQGRLTFTGETDAQFGWLATLESEFPSTSRPGPIPLWERGWQDPINGGFVRRRLPALVNPLITQQVGDDGYPITHYVGVAGLGVDGPTLPANHPRAGIFGYDRTTRPEEVVDGLSNTIMIAGVTDGLGSWSNADATIRPFTQEPYINGPDGFGTGQADGMYVLMADGSVKFLSDQTDPVVMRCMTAMADGFSLDPAIPGDPLDVEPPVMIAEQDPVTPVEPQPMVDTPMVELTPEELALLSEPIDVPVAIDPPRVFIERSLQVSLTRFEQPNVELRLVLLTLEELIGASFGWNVPDTDEWNGVLERTVSVNLENTTVEVVLSEVLTSVGLTYRLEDEGIYIEPL